jgi:hypothetical protein
MNTIPFKGSASFVIVMAVGRHAAQKQGSQQLMMREVSLTTRHSSEIIALIPYAWF